MSLNIELDIRGKKFYITSDEYNIIMHDGYTETKTGTRMENPKYFSNIPKAINYILALNIKRSDAKTLHEIVEVIEEIKKTTDRLLSKG